MSYSYDLVVALGSAQAGLTLTASVRDAAGTALASQPAYTVVEHGDGWYSYHTSAMPDGHRGVVRILSGATIMAVGVVSPAETENADVKTSTRGTGTSTYAGGDTAGTTTLLSRLTSGRATLLDNLDAAVTTRMATFTYTAPPSAADNLAAINADAGFIALKAVGAALDTMIETADLGVTYAYTADALAEAPTGGGAAPTAGEVADAVRAELAAELALLDAAVSTRSTYAGADTAGTTTLLGRLTSGRADGLDALGNLDVASSTLATAAALAAAKADTAAILADTAELQADWHDGGRLDLLLDDAAAGGSGGTVQLDLAQTLDAPRALDAVADAAMTVNDALWAATVEMAGDMARSGATLTKKTPATGTTVRTLTFDSAANPTSRT